MQTALFRPEAVRERGFGFIPGHGLHRPDYSTLETVPGSYVTDDGARRPTDEMLDGKPELKRTVAIWIRALRLR